MYYITGVRPFNDRIISIYITKSSRGEDTLHASSPEEDQRGGPLERYKEEKGTSRERERGLNEGSCLDGIKERKKKEEEKSS